MCCGRPSGTAGARAATTPTSGASSGAEAAGQWTVTTAAGSTLHKSSEIAAKLYVAAHPGATYAKPTVGA